MLPLHRRLRLPSPRMRELRTMNSESASTTICRQQASLRRQLERRGIRDQRVLDAIERTRRDLFVPQRVRHRAYEDTALPIEFDQTISQPYIVALMTEALGLTGVETVLEVGTGSGYQTAILAQLCRTVTTIERIPSLSEAARNVLGTLNVQNVDYRVGDGTLGCADCAPFDGILVTAASPSMPEPLYGQLKTGGAMVVPVGDASIQSLQLILKGQSPQVRELCGCRFVKLIGEAGWSPQ